MNFDFLNNVKDFPKLSTFCHEAEEFVISNPEISAQSSRKALETLVKAFYKIKYGNYPENASLFELIDDGCFSSYIDDTLLAPIHFVRQIGNNAAHGEVVTKVEAMNVLESLYITVCSILNFLGVIKHNDPFNSALCPKSSLINKSLEDTDEKRSPSFIQYKKNIDSNINKPKGNINFSEAETRKIFIDTALKEAGWDVLNIQGKILPSKACIEIKVNGMPNNQGIGYVDYVLFDKDSTPLAVIEAKRTSKDEVEGSKQASCYADCLEKMYGFRPVVFYTNGYKIMMVDDGYPARRVFGYYSQEELHSLIIRRNVKTLVNTKINPNISDRPFIQTAVTKTCESFNKKRRKALLVMATGTGKTRCAISLVDVLQRNGWAKHILFLADRTALVTQAKRAFMKFLPSSSFCVLSEEKEEERNYNASVFLSTYNTMIRLVDCEDKKFGVGMFDLLIADECHRSIYNKYQAIFHYFDSLVLGLTATPREQIDSSTYEVFDLPKGEPTFSYDYPSAVKDGFLVDFKTIEKTTNILKNNLRYDDLTPDEQEQYDETFGDGQGNHPKEIDGKEFYSRIINSGTIDAMLQTVMNEGLRVDSGERLGKTIIFAVNHKHAETIVNRFKTLYPEKGNDFCQLIDNYVNYAQKAIDEFEIKDKEPIIAVSVAMLDTGIDVPEVLNLVFFKRVYSKIKFWQMIGRGTRVCKGLNVFSPSKDYFEKKSTDPTIKSFEDKQGFYVFDFCDVFSYFKENIDGRKEPLSSLNLTQRIFNLKLDLLLELQKYEHQINKREKDYYLKTRSQLLALVSHLNRSLINVKYELKYVEKYSIESNWLSLNLISEKEIKNHITFLIDPDGDDEKSKVFDLWLFNMELAMLEGGKDFSKAIQKVTTATRFLLDNKLSIPEVNNKKELLEDTLDDNFWENISIDGLEKVRTGLRNLIKYLERIIFISFTTNFKDFVIDKDSGNVVVGGFKDYRQSVMDFLTNNTNLPVLKKIKNIEPLDANDISELQFILWKKLGSKEDYNALVGNQQSVGAFVRKVIGVSQDKVNEILLDYYQKYNLNSSQQEFLKKIVDYVRENGDIVTSDLLTQKFSTTDYNVLFQDTNVVYNFINLLHNSIVGTLRS